MATILLVEDTPDLGLFETELLEAAGHKIVRCGGGPTSYSVCPLLRGRSCSLADEAHLIMFSCRLFTELHGRTYRGMRLLQAYRAHPAYARLPFLVVAQGSPGKLEGTGPVEVVEKFSDPAKVVAAVRDLLEKTGKAVAEVVYAPGDVVRRARYAAASALRATSSFERMLET